MGAVWEHVELIDEITAALPEAVQRMGRCRRPLYSAAATSPGNFELWRTMCIWRAELNNWELIPRRKPPSVFEGRLRPHWKVAARNIDGARCFLLRSELAKSDEDRGAITLDSGAILQVPPSSDDVPELPSGASALRPPPGYF